MIFNLITLKFSSDFSNVFWSQLCLFEVTLEVTYLSWSIEFLWRYIWLWQGDNLEDGRLPWQSSTNNSKVTSCYSGSVTIISLIVSIIVFGWLYLHCLITYQPFPKINSKCINWHSIFVFGVNTNTLPRVLFNSNTV